MWRKIALVLTLVLPWAAAAAPVNFEAPAQAHGEVAITATWVLLVFDQHEPARATIRTDQATQYTNTTRYGTMRVQMAGVTDVTQTLLYEIPTTSPLAATEIDLSWSTEKGYFLMRADLVLGNTTSNVDSRITTFTAAEGIASSSEATLGYSAYKDQRPGVAGVAIANRNATGQFVASNVSYVGWSGARASCASEAPCVDGGGIQTVYQDSTIQVSNSFLGELHGTGMDVSVAGAGEIIVLGQSVDIDVLGTLRLPLVDAIPNCNCSDPRTMMLTGSIQLESLRSVGQSKMTGNLTGVASSARIDEDIVSPSLLGLGPGPAVLATAGGVALLAVVGRPLLALLVRNPSPLDHPRRRIIYDFILREPGLHVRAIARELGYWPTNLAFHLAVLKRSGLVAERVHGNARRYYENHGRYDLDWKEVAILADSDLAFLFSIINDRGSMTQAEIVDAAAGKGWRRSTTQYRLGKLTQDGLLSAQKMGRLVVYRVTSAPKGNQSHAVLRGTPRTARHGPRGREAST